MALNESPEFGLMEIVTAAAYPSLTIRRRRSSERHVRIGRTEAPGRPLLLPTRVAHDVSGRLLRSHE